MGKLRYLSFQYSKGKGLTVGSVQSRGSLSLELSHNSWTFGILGCSHTPGPVLTRSSWEGPWLCTRVLCGWLALPAGLFFESWGCGICWLSDDSPASEGSLCLFKTLQTVYSQWAVVYSQGTTVRWSWEATGRADLFPVRIQTECECQGYTTKCADLGTSRDIPGFS